MTISKTETGARCKQTNARAMHIILDPKFFAVDSTSQHFTLLKISFIRHGSRTKKTWISFIRHGFSRPYVTPVRHGYVSYYWPRVGEITIKWVGMQIPVEERGEGACHMREYFCLSV